jgi:hypothetical protein
MVKLAVRAGLYPALLFWPIVMAEGKSWNGQTGKF